MRERASGPLGPDKPAATHRHQTQEESQTDAFQEIGGAMNHASRMVEEQGFGSSFAAADPRSGWGHRDFV